jgi:hypothetical protein
MNPQVIFAAPLSILPGKSRAASRKIEVVGKFCVKSMSTTLVIRTDINKDSM